MGILAHSGVRKPELLTGINAAANKLNNSRLYTGKASVLASGTSAARPTFAVLLNDA